MMSRLTRSMRARVGRLIALAYLLCIVAPAAALAWGQAPAPCLADAVVPADLVAIQQHMHDGGARHDHGAMLGQHHAGAPGMPDEHHHDGKGTPGPCCAMMCVTALPAELPHLAMPVQPTSACAHEIAVVMHAEAPALLYRPPIA